MPRTFTLDTTWKFGRTTRSSGRHSGTGRAAAAGDDWKIQWDATTVAPGLDKGPLSFSTLVAQPAARVLDRTGADLLTQHVVTLVDVAPGADVNAVAALLNPIAPTITPESLSADLRRRRQARHRRHAARRTTWPPSRPPLSALPNVTLRPQTRLLATDRTLTSPTLSGLSELWQQRTDAAAGWAVTAQTAAGAQRVGGQDAQARRRHRQHAGHRHAARRRGRAGAAAHARRRWSRSSRPRATCWPSRRTPPPTRRARSR